MIVTPSLELFETLREPRWPQTSACLGPLTLFLPNHQASLPQGLLAASHQFPPPFENRHPSTIGFFTTFSMYLYHVSMMYDRLDHFNAL